MFKILDVFRHLAERGIKNQNALSVHAIRAVNRGEPGHFIPCHNLLPVGQVPDICQGTVYAMASDVVRSNSLQGFLDEGATLVDFATALEAELERRKGA